MEELRALLLLKLARRGKWEHSHMPCDRLLRWVEAKRGGGEARECFEELKRLGMVHVKPTHYGKEVSLNIRMREQILALIEKHFPQFKEFL